MHSPIGPPSASTFMGLPAAVDTSSTVVSAQAEPADIAVVAAALAGPDCTGSVPPAAVGRESGAAKDGPPHALAPHTSRPASSRVGRKRFMECSLIVVGCEGIQPALCGARQRVQPTAAVKA